MPVVYHKTELKLTFTGELQGGVPLGKDALMKWLEFRASKGAKITPEQVQEDIDALPQDEETAEKLRDQMLVGFFRDQEGYLFNRDITMKAHIKDMLARLNIWQKRRGGAGKQGGKSAMLFGGFFRGIEAGNTDKLYMYRADGSRVNKPDQITEAVAHVDTPKGRQSSIKYNEAVIEPIMKLNFFIVEPSALKLSDIEEAFALGQEYGYSANRSMGHGRYLVTEFKAVGDVEIKLGQRI